MTKQEIIADMAEKHQVTTGQTLKNSAACTPNSNDPWFMCTWNHNIPKTILLYCYNGSCKIEYGTKNTLVQLDSVTNPMQSITPEAGAKNFSFALTSFTLGGSPQGLHCVGASW